MKWNGLGSLVLMVSQTLLFTGCTSALWEKDRFANYHRPANPNHLQVFFSNQRRELAVQYDEAQDKDKSTQSRAYWLDREAPGINGGRRPRFVSLENIHGLVAVPVTNSASANYVSGT